MMRATTKILITGRTSSNHLDVLLFKDYRALSVDWKEPKFYFPIQSFRCENMTNYGTSDMGSFCITLEMSYNKMEATKASIEWTRKYGGEV